MIGTGTQADPYVIDNWWDFVTAISYSGTYVQFPEGGGTINMNDIAPEAVSTATIKCAEINGNGWDAKNLYFKNTDAFLAGYSPTKIKNLHFSEFNGETFSGGSLFGLDGYQRTRFELCSFSGRADGRGIVFDLGNSDYTYDYFYRCAFKLNCYGSAVPFYASHRTAPLEYCNIFINCENSSSSSVSVTLKNSYLQGDTHGGIKIHGYDDPNYNSIINMNVGGSISSQSQGYSNILINSEKVTGNIPNVFKQVTTAQLKDATYLKSIGFPIAVVNTIKKDAAYFKKIDNSLGAE